jgi:hypothetical protein
VSASYPCEGEGMEACESISASSLFSFYAKDHWLQLKMRALLVAESDAPIPVRHFIYTALFLMCLRLRGGVPTYSDF